MTHTYNIIFSNKLQIHIMQKDFCSLSQKEQQDLVSSLGELLKKHEIATTVNISREVVFNYMENCCVEDNYTLTVQKELPPSE